MASVYRKQGDFARAQDAARQAEKHGGRPHASFFLALDRGDLDRARRWLEGWARRPLQPNRGMRPWQRELSALRGQLACKAGRAAEAIDHLQEARRHLPAPWAIESFESGLADCYLELGRFDEAIAEYERILRLNPNQRLWHYRLGLACQRKGDTGRAASEWRRFLEIWKDADSDIPELLDARRRLQGIKIAGR